MGAQMDAWTKTYGHSVIPKRHIPFPPLKSRVDLRTRRHDLIQEADNMIALSLWYTHNLGDEAGVEED